MSCACPAFPFNFKRIHHHLISISYLVIFTILISSTDCVQLLPSWNVAMAHGRQIIMSSTSSGDVRQVLSIPPPISSIDQWQNQLKNSTNISIDSHTKATELWRHQAFKKLEFDPSRGLFFIISSPWNLQSIVVFNITSNQTHSLLTKDSSASIGGIVYHNGYLYWTNRTSDSIWKMNVGDEIGSWKPAEDFYKPAYANLHDLTIDAKTNKLFFTNSIHNGYKIQYIDCLNPKANGVITESSKALLGLTTDDSFLYWVEVSAQGYKIQRTSLSNSNQEHVKEIIQQGDPQIISTLSIACSQNFLTKSLLWSTCNSKTVWQKNIFSINTQENPGQKRPKELYFGSSCPQAIISKNFALKDWSTCAENSTVESRVPNVVTNPPIPLNVALSTTPIPTRTRTTSSPFTRKNSLFTTTTTAETTTSGTTTTAETTTSGTTTTAETTTSGTTTTAETTTSGTTTTARSKISTTSTTTTTSTLPPTDASTIVVVPTHEISENNYNNETFVVRHASSSSTSYNFTTSTVNIILLVICSSLLIIIVILTFAVVYLYRKVRRLQLKPRIRRRVIVSRSSRDASIPSMCELVDIENCCNMNECDTPCYERLGPDSSNSSVQSEYKTSGEFRTEDKERLIDT